MRDDVYYVNFHRLAADHPPQLNEDPVTLGAAPPHAASVSG
jgi:hypothetical protein